jgi:hypothetical protein
VMLLHVLFFDAVFRCHTLVPAESARLKAW